MPSTAPVVLLALGFSVLISCPMNGLEALPSRRLARESLNDGQLSACMSRWLDRTIGLLAFSGIVFLKLFPLFLENGPPPPFSALS